jgi:hypothetical protein
VNLVLSLSSRLIEYLFNGLPDEGPNPVAYFYFQSSKDSESQTAEAVIASLLKQLASQLPTFPENLVDAYDKWVDVGKQLDINRPGREQLASIFTACCHSKDFPVYVLVESFHQCEEEQREILTPHFVKFVDAGIRLCITSRPQLRLSLRESFAPRQALEQKIEADATDVEHYVKKKLGREYSEVYSAVEIAIKAKSTGRSSLTQEGS